MPADVIAIFDIGKTNKKILLFDSDLKLVYQEEQKFDELPDDDGFACDDIAKLETWMHECLKDIIKSGKYNVKAMNFATYGATLVYLDDKGKRLTTAYNYLKPMPDDVIAGFYGPYGGTEEFCRRTASPALGMLNSGLQVLWLKRTKPDVFAKVKTILHLPQYLSYCFTGKCVSEFTSIGCHTAMWDFDNHRYHNWLANEGITLPGPVSNYEVTGITIEGQTVKTGIGIHDSSASLVPYFMETKEQFILLSTGTWCIFMNPFNSEPLTADQLRKDSLCYMSIQQKQVKSSRLFLGHIHDVNVERLTKHFGVKPDHYKTVKTDAQRIEELIKALPERKFFKQGISADYVDNIADLSEYRTFEDAYHRLMADLVDLGMESLALVTPADDRSKIVYVSGGFARSDLFVKLLAARLPGKTVKTSDIDNATALGAAMVIYAEAFGSPLN